jgi:ribosomal protein S18 acetylase RimI-like enzyme
MRQAGLSDIAAVTALVNAAYGHYVQRIGMTPGPMTRDYQEVIGDRNVTVAERGGEVVGVIVLHVTDEGFGIDNVAVHPSCQGQGLGRALLNLAETRAREAGFGSVYLYTHEKMTENLDLYAKIGYVEYRRSAHDGFALVHMRKHLG